MEPALAEEDTEGLGIGMRLGHFAPPGILERLMSSCYGLGKYHKFWKRGALIETELHSLLINSTHGFADLCHDLSDRFAFITSAQPNQQVSVGSREPQEEVLRGNR